MLSICFWLHRSVKPLFLSNKHFNAIQIFNFIVFQKWRKTVISHSHLIMWNPSYRVGTCLVGNAVWKFLPWFNDTSWSQLLTAAQGCHSFGPVGWICGVGPSAESPWTPPTTHTHSLAVPGVTAPALGPALHALPAPWSRIVLLFVWNMCWTGWRWLHPRPAGIGSRDPGQVGTGATCGEQINTDQGRGSTGS